MKSIWESNQFHRQPDLVVVGAGIVGLFTALFHKRAFPHHHVLVLERGPFPSGASAKNAGFVCFGSPSELLADLSNEGTDAMLDRVEERWLGLLELRKELGDLAIGFEPTGGHEMYAEHDPLYTKVADGFDRLNEQLHPIFGKAVFQWDDASIHRFGLTGVKHLVRTDLEGPLDTGMLMRSLLQKSVGSGVLVRTNAHLTGIIEQASGVELSLANSEVVRAANVVVATNGYSKALFPELDVQPARGQVLLTEPVEGLRLKGTFHYDEGYVYFRDYNGRVLLGGGRNLDIAGETTTEDATTPLIQNELERLLREVILPGKTIAVAQRWSGIMGMGASKSPIVQHMGPRVVVAVRLGGMGVAIGIRVARQAAGLIG